MKVRSLDSCPGLSLVLAVFTCMGAYASDGDKDVTALEWQKQSLKGITSIKYRVAFDESASLGDTVKTSLTKVNVAAKETAQKDDKATLGGAEARVIVVAKYKDNNKTWVGLTVEQQCQLTRDASVKWDGETYRTGKVVDRKKEAAAAKTLCDDFVSAFNKVAPKKK